MASGLLGRPDAQLGQIRLAALATSTVTGSDTLTAAASLSVSGNTALPAGHVVGGFSDGGHAWVNSSLAADYARAKSVNAQWVRTDWDWWGVQDTAGQQPNWPLLDGIVNTADSLGLKVLPIIHSVPPWANGGTGNYGPPNPLSLWTDFALAAGLRYIPRGLTVWEVGNEPNLVHDGWTIDGGYYVNNMLRPIVTGLRQAAAQVGIPIQIVFAGLSPSTANPASADVPTFVNAAYAAGAQSLFDVMGFHPYTGVNSPLTAAQMNSEVTGLRSLMVGQGDSAKQIWATEYGWYTLGTGSVTEAQLAQLAADAAQRWSSYSYTGPLFWYSVRDRQTYAANTGSTEDYFGAWRNDGTPKTGVNTTIASTFGGVAAAATSMSATSTLSAAGGRAQAGAAPFVAAASLTAAGSATARGAAPLTASATLASTGTVTKPAAGALAAQASLSSQASAATSAAATLTGAATLAPAATRGTFAAASLTATGGLTAAGLLTVAPSVVITASAELTGTASAATTAAAALAGAATLAAAAAQTVPAAAALTATATLASTSTGVPVAGATMTATASLTTAGASAAVAAATLLASTALTPAGQHTAVATQALSAQSDLTATSLVTVPPSMLLDAGSALTATAFRGLTAVAQMDAGAGLLVGAVGSTVATPDAFAAESDLAAAAVVTTGPSTLLVAASDLAVSELPVATAGVLLAAEADLTTVAATASTVALTAESALGVDGEREVTGADLFLQATATFSAHWDRAKVSRPYRGVVVRP